MAEPRGDVQLAAVGGVAGAAGVARGRQGAGAGHGGGGHADAGGRAGDDCGDVAAAVGAGVRGLDCTKGSCGASWCCALLGMGILVALVCAVQLLPFLELLAHSQRDTGYGSSDWAMPSLGLGQLSGAAVPDLSEQQGLFLQTGQYWTSSYYAGIGTVLLVAVAVWRVRGVARARPGGAVSAWPGAGFGQQRLALPRAALVRSRAGVCPLPGEVRYPDFGGRAAAGRVWVCSLGGGGAPHSVRAVPRKAR